MSVPKPKIIEINQDQKWQKELIAIFGKLKVEKEILNHINDSLTEAIQLYSDTLSDENIDIFYNNLVHGSLLSSDLRYKLKVPIVITNERIKQIPTNQNQWLIHGEIGGNIQTFNNLSIGIQHISKKGFSKGYRYNPLQNTHHISIGVRIF